MKMSPISDPSPPPGRRRRSSLMKRKSIGPAVVLHTREVAIREYICKAKEEQQEWANLYGQRKSQIKIATDVFEQASSDPPTLSFDDVKRDLTEDDLKNLQQPDYGKLCSDIDKFVEDVAILKTSADNLNALINLNNLLAKSRLNALSKNICTYLDVAPLWRGNPAKYSNPKV